MIPPLSRNSISTGAGVGFVLLLAGTISRLTSKKDFLRCHTSFTPRSCTHSGRERQLGSGFPLPSALRHAKCVWKPARPYGWRCSSQRRPTTDFVSATSTSSTPIYGIIPSRKFLGLFYSHARDFPLLEAPRQQVRLDLSAARKCHKPSLQPITTILKEHTACS